MNIIVACTFATSYINYNHSSTLSINRMEFDDEDGEGPSKFSRSVFRLLTVCCCKKLKKKSFF